MTEVKKPNWLWSATTIFLFFWLGDQLLKAFYTAEITGFRFTNLITFDQEPIWFVFTVMIKLAFFIGSSVYIYLQFIRKRLW